MEWIKVSERLPEILNPEDGFVQNDDLLVLFFIPYKSYEFGFLNSNNEWEIPDSGCYSIESVSHYCQLPTLMTGD